MSKKVRVYGVTQVGISIVVNVPDDATEEDIIEIAYDEFGGIANYCGNGGVDKLIGVRNHNESIEYFDDDIQFALNGEDDFEYLDED